jgi:3D (Asp-Asp-Asp) domain-containing protein
MAEKKISLLISVICLAGLFFWAVAAVFAMNVRSGYEVEKEQIPFKIRVKHSGFLQEGWKVWLKEGIPGLRNAVAEKFYIAGSTIKENIIYETEILKKPVEAFLIKGHSKKSNPITVPKETFAHFTYDMEATAYDPSPESNGVEWAGTTALGWRTRYGIVAVDPRIIALRSLIYVDGYGFAWAGDTGGDIKGKRIDLCYNTTQEALRWGRRKVRVYILGNKPMAFYMDKAAAAVAVK